MIGTERVSNFGLEICHLCERLGKDLKLHQQHQSVHDNKDMWRVLHILYIGSGFILYQYSFCIW